MRNDILVGDVMASPCAAPAQLFSAFAESHGVTLFPVGTEHGRMWREWHTAVRSATKQRDVAAGLNRMMAVSGIVLYNPTIRNSDVGSKLGDIVAHVNGDAEVTAVRAHQYERETARLKLVEYAANNLFDMLRYGNETDKLTAEQTLAFALGRDSR